MTTNDPELEIDAMKAVATALASLDADAQKRVLVWAGQRFLGGSPTLGRMVEESPLDEEDTEESPDEPTSKEQFSHFADLYDAFNPSSSAERALIGGYWVQVVEGSSDFGSTKVNNLLKDVGHGVPSISKVYIRLREQQPALVRQLTKSGKTKQARKTYKLTTAGIRTVEDRIS